MDGIAPTEARSTGDATEQLRELDIRRSSFFHFDGLVDRHHR